MAWVESVAPTLPIARLDRYVIDTRYSSIPGVLFEVALHRVKKGGLLAQISIVHLVDGRNLEAQRTSRIRRAYGCNHAKNLAAWRQLGARSVLIFEENDIFVTNHERVAEALMQVEQGRVDRPDEIYLLSSAVDKQWALWVLRADDHVYDELSVWGDSLTEIDPSTLVDITVRETASLEQAVIQAQDAGRRYICVASRVLDATPDRVGMPFDQVAIRNGGHCHAKVELCSPSSTKSVH